MRDRNHRAFTLIELLVVVAIIGILAAVGVVAYNGYTEAAKISATKSNHQTAVKFIESSIMKCSIGEELILRSVIGLKTPNSSKGSSTTTDLCQLVSDAAVYGNAVGDVATAFYVHFALAEKWCNPYGWKDQSGQSCQEGIQTGGSSKNGRVGQVQLLILPPKILIDTKYKCNDAISEKCTNYESLQHTINFKKL